MNIAIVGATGKVGSKFIDVIQERNIKADNFYLYASSKSEGKIIKIFDKEYKVLVLNEENIKGKKIDYALFSAGGTISKEFAPIFVRYGAIVIDNSSCFRRHADVPLVVPEVNKEEIFKNKGIIANPNCSTIGAVLPLKALYDKYGLDRIVISTYQAVSGAGQKGVEDLKNGEKGIKPQKFGYPIYSNVLPQIDDFLDNGYTKEEDKMIFEIKKILNDFDIKITATATRVPVYNCHSESINVTLKKDFEIEDAKKVIGSFENTVLVDDTSKNMYPMPITADGHDEVFVGRIRKDNSFDKTLNMFVVSDNIRKGAATNAVQILEILLKGKENEKRL